VKTSSSSIPPLNQLTAHRPWPMPPKRWVISMRWEDLLFMHWQVPAKTLRAHLPPGLELDLFNGGAWLGVVPFRMCATRLRFTVPIPTASSFPELNVRTYVRQGNKPGVWFFSLDAGSPLAVRAARSFFHLPYFHARMSISRNNETIDYRSQRRRIESGLAAFRAQYRPIGQVEIAGPGSLAHWLTERYCLYSVDARGRLWRGDIHHQRWPLQPAEADVELNTMVAPLGFGLPDQLPLLHFARKLEVVAWRIERV
jgi:uncharacterized protein YqjF (DUF2071 family)